jgi:hypothetical protein
MFDHGTLIGCIDNAFWTFSHGVYVVEYKCNDSPVQYQKAVRQLLRARLHIKEHFGEVPTMIYAYGNQEYEVVN